MASAAAAAAAAEDAVCGFQENEGTGENEGPTAATATVAAAVRTLAPASVRRGSVWVRSPESAARSVRHPLGPSLLTIGPVVGPFVRLLRNPSIALH